MRHGQAASDTDLNLIKSAQLMGDARAEPALESQQQTASLADATHLQRIPGRKRSSQSLTRTSLVETVSKEMDLKPTQPDIKDDKSPLSDELMRKKYNPSHHLALETQ